MIVAHPKPFPSNRSNEDFPKTGSQLRCLRILLGGLAVVLGLVFEWLGRATPHDIDGISYLDMGDAYLRGDWKTAINGLWSPLYALLISGVVKIAKPSPSWEAPLVHLVGFVIYVAALLSFDFLWIELSKVLRERTSSQLESWITFSDWAWLLLGYCLFLWVSLQLITLTSETPDMLLAVAVYLASALLLRISSGRARTGSFVLLGFVLGLGYLTKAASFRCRSFF